MKYWLLCIALLLTLPLAAQEKKLYVIVFLSKNSEASKISEEQSNRLSQAHQTALQKLAQEDKLLVAAPYEGGGGLLVMNTTSVGEAGTWLKADPAIEAGIWQTELSPYQSRTGRPCRNNIQEDLPFQFVRFDAVVSKFTAASYPDIIRKHDAFIKRLVSTGNVVAEGIFGDYDGGMMVIKGSLQREVIEADPGVQEGLLDITYQKVSFMKGSFCP
jgi:uncharacterized protein YciI